MTSLLAAAIVMALGASPDAPSPALPRVRTEPLICMPTDVPFPVDATGPAPEAITVRFEIGDDGAAKDISIGFPVGAAVPELLVDAARQSVDHCTWVPMGENPSDPATRKGALRLPVVVARKDLGGLMPPKKKGDCFTNALDFRSFTFTKRKLVITAKFPIFADGKAGRVRLLERFDDPAIQSQLERTITDAAKACEWIPGKDGSGRPTSIYVVMPFRIN